MLIGNVIRAILFFAIKEPFYINNQVTSNEETVPARESVTNPRWLIHPKNAHFSKQCHFIFLLCNSFLDKRDNRKPLLSLLYCQKRLIPTVLLQVSVSCSSLFLVLILNTMVVFFYLITVNHPFNNWKFLIINNILAQKSMNFEKEKGMRKEFAHTFGIL